MRVAAPALVVLLTLAAFWPALDGQFVNWDDDKNFLSNPHFRGLDPASLRWMFTSAHLGHYHPLTWITHAADYALWGLDPAGYHLTNLLLHAANAVLFYLVALRLLGPSPFPAALAALLFAVHPLRVESVAWATERRDVLAGLFFLLSVLAYLRGRRSLSLGVFAAALLSKAIVVSLPVVLLALDIFPLRRFGRRAILEKAPWFLLAAIASVVTLAVQPAGVGGFAEHAATLPGLRIGLSLYGLTFYLWKTLVPVGLYPQYVLPADVSPSDPRILLAGLAVAALTGMAWLWRRRFPALLPVWICCVAGLLPVLSLFRVDTQQFAADHHTYLATMGIALVGAWALAALPAPAALPIAAAVVLVLAALTHRQTGVWRDSIRLWTYTLEGAPDSVVAHNNLGEALAEAGRLPEAAVHFAQAVRIRPRYAQAHYNLGQALQKQGRFEDSVESLRRAFEIDPRFTGSLADAHYNFANVLQGRRDFTAAIAQYEEALRHNPALADAHNNWGVALEAVSRSADAATHYRQALALDPRNADAHNNLGLSLEAAGNAAEAVAHYREALRSNPTHRDAARNLARHTGR